MKFHKGTIYQQNTAPPTNKYKSSNANPQERQFKAFGLKSSRYHHRHHEQHFVRIFTTFFTLAISKQ